MNADIIIVGAGAAGLMAARELSKAGKKVIILEARDRIGGRIYPLSEKEWGYPAQGGAEFVHGHAPYTHQLLKEANLHLDEEGEWWQAWDGVPTVFTPDLQDPVLKEKLALLKEDMTVSQFFDTHLPGPEHAELRRLTFRRVEGYYAGDPEKTSAFAVREEVEAGEGDGGGGNTPLREGYGALISYLEEECRSHGVELLLGKEVVKIEWSTEENQIVCKDNSTFSASKVIVTVPLPVLKTIQYSPAVPEKIEAASQIGFGAVLKIAMKFKTAWWQHVQGKDLTKMFIILSYFDIPTWWTPYPHQAPVLFGWIAGPGAEKVSKKSEDEILQTSYESLSKIFGISIEDIKKELISTKIINWPQDPYAQGAYSYPTPQALKAIAELLKPVDNKLFFAGEAISLSEISGTVEAALESGFKTAHLILGDQAK